MKKILIASACAFTLCFTSCASKQAPESEAQTETPQIENEAADEKASKESYGAISSDNKRDETQTDVNESSDSQSESLSSLTSEDFPEPEIIEEPEIITLEAQEEISAEETEAPTEPVESEEPPEFTLINQDENTEDSDKQENESASDEALSVTEENNIEDITANDIIIESKADSDGISGGIDITDEDTISDDGDAELKKEIIPSRSVTLKKFEYLDVTYPGSGWIYMGLTDNSKDLAYFGRKLGTKDTKFSLQARAAGRKIIHFYRNDPLTGQYLDDYIEVIISAENGSNKNHIEAPEYKLPVQKKEKPVKKNEEAASEETQTNAATETTQKSASSENTAAAKAVSPSSSSNDTVSKNSEFETNVKADTKASEKAEENNDSQAVPQAQNTQPAQAVQTVNQVSLLQEAQVLYNEKEYKAALSKLNQFFEYSTDDRDEALYLKGQILEAKSEVRDIKGAIDAYTTLTKNYPASRLWDSANKRIIYLKRFYLEVR